MEITKSATVNTTIKIQSRYDQSNQEAIRYETIRTWQVSVANSCKSVYKSRLTYTNDNTGEKTLTSEGSNFQVNQYLVKVFAVSNCTSSPATSDPRYPTLALKDVRISPISSQIANAAFDSEFILWDNGEPYRFDTHMETNVLNALNGGSSDFYHKLQAVWDSSNSNWKIKARGFGWVGDNLPNGVMLRDLTQSEFDALLNLFSPTIQLHFLDQPVTPSTTVYCDLISYFGSVITKSGQNTLVLN
jgi:hypothetical protein